MHMSGFFTDYANNKLLDMVFGSAAYSPPATLYLGLSLSSASKNGSTSEPSSGGYARVALTNNATNFPAAIGGTKSNAAQATFPAPTADWGTVQSLFVADAPSGGNVLAMADLTAPRTITRGSAPARVAVGALFLSHT
jgi:hypothetical protein